MPFFLKKLFSPQEIQFILKETLIDRSLFKKEPTDCVSNTLSSLNHQFPCLNFFRYKIEYQLKNLYNFEFKFSHTFCRFYFNNSELKIHTDRKGLDITATLCVTRETNFFPLYISNIIHNDSKWYINGDHSVYLKNYTAFELDPGDVAVCLGTKEPHWREKLKCDPEMSNYYIFFHWTRL